MDSIKERQNRRALLSRPVFLYLFHIISGMNVDKLLSSLSFSAFVYKIDVEIPLLSVSVWLIPV